CLEGVEIQRGRNADRGDGPRTGRDIGSDHRARARHGIEGREVTDGLLGRQVGKRQHERLWERSLGGAVDVLRYAEGRDTRNAIGQLIAVLEDEIALAREEPLEELYFGRAARERPFEQCQKLRLELG